MSIVILKYFKITIGLANTLDNFHQACSGYERSDHKLTVDNSHGLGLHNCLHHKAFQDLVDPYPRHSLGEDSSGQQ